MSSYQDFLHIKIPDRLHWKRMMLIAICVASFTPRFAFVAWAAEEISAAHEPQKIRLVTGKSIVLKNDEPVKRVSIANPEVADFILITPQEIYLTGKSFGTTTLMLWQNSKISKVYDLEVAIDLSGLKEKLHQFFPEERELQVLATNDSITLLGRVSNAAKVSQVISMAEAYAPEGKVKNLIEVGGVHQVMLEVRVAEMQRSITKRFGFNMNYVKGSTFGVTTLGGLTQLVNPDDANIASGGPFGLFVSPTVNALFRFNNNDATWTGFIDALREDGLAKVLAEPTLIALSGQTARFLAGGEFPVPVPQGLGTVAIEYKSFGVGLSFTPTVISENKISIKVLPEVSELDFSIALQFQGFTIPGLTTRKAATVVELGDGQSFAIAGLLRENVRDAIQRYPALGDIPILGALFRSRAFQKAETELVIVITPHLVKPLDMRKQTLPTDYYIEPDNTEFYLLGLPEGRKRSDNPDIRGTMDGDFGHIVSTSH